MIVRRIPGRAKPNNLFGILTDQRIFLEPTIDITGIWSMRAQAGIVTSHSPLFLL